MRLIISLILAALMVSCATPPARSQSTYTVVATCGTPPATLSVGAVRTGYMDTSGQICSVAAAGVGGATAANQVLQLAQETAINTVLGTVTASPTANTIADRLKTINTTLGTPIQATGGTVGLVAGTAIAGKFGIDQTTPGTTNGAAIVGVNAATALAGNGATGTGALRVTIANDNTLPTGWASSTSTNQTAIQAPVAPATATATKSTLLGAQATTGAVNPTNGQQGALSSDTNNNLLVSAGGAPNIATAQASVTTGNISVASARPLRRAITITNVTGTSAVYCGNTGVTTSTGTYLGATAGSSITLNTTAAVFCTVASVTQTVTAAETY